MPDGHPAFQESDPATTYFPAWQGSIIGAEGLTAVFGMGTGVAPLLWSPEHNLGAPLGGDAKMEGGGRGGASGTLAGVERVGNVAVKRLAD